jgi:hypothetical protein
MVWGLAHGILDGAILDKDANIYFDQIKDETQKHSFYAVFLG